jgi:hypothetical protein
MAITVGELIETLSKLDKARIVVMSRDSEGNGYSPLAGYESDITFYEKDGEIWYQKLTTKMIEHGFSDEDVRTGGKPCVVLWPE